MNVKFEDICYLLPLRICIVGPMQVGKSTFLINFLMNFEKVTNIKHTDRQINVQFFYNSTSSLRSAKEAIQGKSCFIDIEFYNGLPTTEQIESFNATQEFDRLIILEDSINSIRGQSVSYLSELSSFVTNSRHYGISIICIFHEFPFGGSSARLTFEKTFIRNATCVVLFENLCTSQQTKLFMSRIGINYEDFESVCKIATKICKLDKENGVHSNPAIVINLDVRQNFSDKLHRIALDIFNRWLIVKQ